MQHPIVRVWLVVAFSLQPPVDLGAASPLEAHHLAQTWHGLLSQRFEKSLGLTGWLLQGGTYRCDRTFFSSPYPLFFCLFFLLADTRQAASGATARNTEKLLEAFCVLRLPSSAMPDSDGNAGMSCIGRPRQQGGELGKGKGVLVRSLRSSTFNHHIISSCPWPSSALLLLQGFVANF